MSEGQQYLEYEDESGHFEKVITQTQKEVDKKAKVAAKKADENFDAMALAEKEVESIEELAEWREYSFNQEINNLVVKPYHEWYEEREVKKRAKKAAHDDFWFETPKGLFTVLFTLAGAFSATFLAHCFHLFGWR